MESEAGPDGSLRRLLDAAEDASPVSSVEAVTRELGHALGAVRVSFLIADLSGRALVRLTHVALATAPLPGDRHDDQERATVLPFDGGPAEQALRSQQVQVLPPSTGPCWTVLAPVTERGEAVGLLELELPDEPTADVVAEVRRTAHVLGYVVIASRRHTDLYEWGQRSAPFSLSAEIQRRLLPSAYTCEAGSFTLAAWLEPAETIGGDTFDYSVGRDVLHLSVTDAVGHGVDSALTATLCVGSLRHTRRHGATLLEQATTTNEALLEHGSGPYGERFATALLGRLDLRTGDLALVNAGHTAPYLARDGQVRLLELPADLPLGLLAGSTYRSTTLRLQPGDRLVVVTDGMLERAAVGVDLVEQVLLTRGSHPREATRELADLVIEVSGGTLADDAALLVLDWHGDHDVPRRTVAGADAGPPRSRPGRLSPETGAVTWTAPEAPPDDGPTTGDERALLEGALRSHRTALLRICAGATAEQLATRALPPSQLSLLGLVRHLAKVERIWLRTRVAGEDVPPLHGGPGDPADFADVDPTRAEAELLALQQEWVLADRAVAGVSLEHEVVVRGDTLSLRMVYLHLLGEYARHAGHADLLREALDGVTGR